MMQNQQLSQQEKKWRLLLPGASEPRLSGANREDFYSGSGTAYAATATLA